MGTFLCYEQYFLMLSFLISLYKIKFVIMRWWEIQFLIAFIFFEF